MTREEAIKWLENLNNDIGKLQFQSLWGYGEAIAEIIDLLSAETVGVGRYENAMQKLREMPMYLNGIKAKQIKKNSAEAKWIPCNERMPTEDAKYLVQMGYGIIQVLSWANNLEEVDDFDFYNKKHGGWYEYDSEWGYCERNTVIAWMPLPKPYGESEVDE